MRWFSLALILVGCVLVAVGAQAGEVCHYSGKSTYSGKLDVVTKASGHGSSSDLQVLLQFRVSAFFQSIDYRSEEISHWYQGKMVGLDLNERSILNGKVQRESWIRFSLDHGTFNGVRIEAKKIEDLTTKHQGMVKYFDPATFGKPWMKDFLASSPTHPPEIDLDIKDYTPTLKPPLGLGFFFVRFLPWTHQVATLFLGGQTKQKRLDFAMVTPAVDSSGVADWLVPLRIGKIKTPDDQPAEFFVSADQKLQSIDLTVAHPLISVHGRLALQGCN